MLIIIFGIFGCIPKLGIGILVASVFIVMELGKAEEYHSALFGIGLTISSPRNQSPVHLWSTISSWANANFSSILILRGDYAAIGIITFPKGNRYLSFAFNLKS